MNHLTCITKTFIPTFWSLAQQILVVLTWDKKWKCCYGYGKSKNGKHECPRCICSQENGLFVGKRFSKMVYFEGWHQKCEFSCTDARFIAVTLLRWFKIGIHIFWKVCLMINATCISQETSILNSHFDKNDIFYAE